MAYAMPVFRLDGTVAAGFAAFKNHLSYFPHSGSVLPELADDLVGHPPQRERCSLVYKPFPKALVKKLIAVRQRQLGKPRTLRTSKG